MKLLALFCDLRKSLQRRMLISGMLRRVALVRTDASGDHISSIIRVTKIVELGTLTVTSNRRTQRRNAT
jgi:hypothetical protein